MSARFFGWRNVDLRHVARMSNARMELAMAPEFEIVWKIEIMRMISFLQADLRLGSH